MSSSTAMPGGSLEYSTLAALWELGSASAREIYARVGEPNGLVYTSIAKVLDRLYAKRLVERKRVGKAFVYRPSVRRQVVERAHTKKALGHLLGSGSKPAIATLVEAIESIDPELLDELARVVNAHRRSRRGS